MRRENRDPPGRVGTYRHFRDAEAFGAAVSDMYRPVELEARASVAFSAGIEAYHVRNILLTHVEASAHQFHHKAAASDADTEPVKVIVPVGGVAVLDQGGNEVTLRPGALGLVDTARPYRILGDAGFDCLILMVPRDDVRIDPQELDQLAASPLTGGSLDTVVTPYFAGLARNLGVLAGAAGLQVAGSTLDLLSALLRAQLAPRLSDPDAHRADLLERATSLILERLGDRSLSPRTIAGELHVSVRYVHKLFASAGTTVSAFVRAKRLDTVRRDLADPLCAHLGIADVAAQWGFADAAHLTRAFKDAFGMTPSEHRRAARST